ncbi:MAG: hypothetical protein Q4A90_00200 [Streptococcus sp.]|nr:hypothetical protein [Streptococcus sp.]
MGKLYEKKKDKTAEQGKNNFSLPAQSGFCVEFGGGIESNFAYLSGERSTKKD